MSMLAHARRALLSRGLLRPFSSVAEHTTGAKLGYEPNHGPNLLPPFTPIDNSVDLDAVDLSAHAQPSWTAEQVDNAVRDNSVFAWGASEPLRRAAVLARRGDGVHITADGDERILDWSAGAVSLNLGHDVPASVLEAVSHQMDTVPFVYGDLYTTEIRARLCKLLAELAPADLNGFLFACSGAEATEAAVRLARRYTGRPKVLSRPRSYHGACTASLATTGDPRRWSLDADVGGGLPGFVKIPEPFPFTFSWSNGNSSDSGNDNGGVDGDEEDMDDVAVERCLGALHDVILTEGPDQIAAVFLESITGGNGWLRPPTAYMQGVRALCDRYGILMICDEVMTGFGRTGRLFGFEHFEGVVPDM